MSGKSHLAAKHFVSILLISGWSVLLGNTPVLACDLETVRMPSPAQLSYDPFDFTTSITSVEMEFRNRAETECNASFRIFDEIDAPPPFYFLGSDLQFTTGVVSSVLVGQSTGVPSAPGVYSVQFAPGEEAAITVDIETLSSPIIEAGDYSKLLFFELMPLGGAPTIDNLESNIGLSVLARAQVNIAGSSASFESGSSVETIDFGELESGESATVFIQYRSNAPAILTFDSENDGFLQHQEVSTARAAYSVTFNGEALGLASAATRRVNPPRTLAGASSPLVITIGEVDSPYSGVYEDLITVSIAPE